MARHSGPLHLTVEDVPDVRVFPARTENRSKSTSEFDIKTKIDALYDSIM